MTTITAIKLKCPKCEGVFQDSVLGSMGYRDIDQQLCREYWGLNPMPFFLSECPHCNHIGWTSDFEQIDEEPDHENVEIKNSCEIFERFVKQSIETNEESAFIAFLSQQSGCCRRVNGENPSEQFDRAVEYFKKAKKEGCKEFGQLTVDEWIERLTSK